MNKQAGFTLIEVMVATLITAMLATMGLTLLNNALRTQDQLKSTLETVQGLELARAVIKNDLAQISPRRARDEFGEPTPFAFEGGADLRGERLMTFVRNGRETIGRQQDVSSLQFVEYVFEDGALKRKSRLHTDAAPDANDRSRTLLEGLDDVQIRFLSDGGWTDIWAAPAREGYVTAPVAISIEIVHPRYGVLESLFLTNAGA